MKSSLISLIILTFLFVSCNKSKDISFSQENSWTPIFGSWYWKRTCGGLIGGSCTYRDKSDKTIIQYDRSMKYYIKRNDTILYSGDFEVRTYGTYNYKIIYNTSDSTYFWFYENTLEINQGELVSEYEKLK
jgi:hypothetical protein